MRQTSDDERDAREDAAEAARQDEQTADQAGRGHDPLAHISTEALQAELARRERLARILRADTERFPHAWIR